MKKETKRALLIFLGLAIVTGILIFNNRKGTIKEELKDFAVKDTASVTKIFLADRKNNKILLEKQSNNQWKVNGKFIVRPDAITTLLETMAKIEVRNPVPKAAFQNVVKQMATMATKVEIYQNNELTKTYYVGGVTTDNLGTYMMLENSSTPFAMHIPGFDGYLSTRYFTDESLWRGRSIFSVNANEIAYVQLEYTQSPKLSLAIVAIDNNKFSLQSPFYKDKLDFDTLAVKDYLLGFKDVNYETVADMAVKKRDSLFACKPIHIIKLKDKRGNETLLKTYFKPAQKGDLDRDGDQLPFDLDRMYARINNNEEVVIIQYFAFDKILKAISYFEVDPIVKK